MTRYLTDIDPDALSLGRNVSTDDVVFELKDSRLRGFGQVWVHRFLPEASLPFSELLDHVSKANSSTTFCKIFGVCTEKEALQFVMPRYHAVLSTIIAGGTLSVERRLHCALDICRCLVELHEHNIHCGVLRLADVLVAASGSCSINTCSTVANMLSSSVFSHPSYFAYMAPEVIMCKFFVNGMKADVWSLACCICRMFDPDSPWPGSSSAQDYCRKVHSSSPTLPRCLPSSLAEMVSQCFSLSMPERPTMKEVLQGLEAAVSTVNLRGMSELPQPQVSQGAVEQASSAQQVDNSSERELANARSKVKQLERKLHELVLQSNQRDEWQQKKLLQAETELADLREHHSSLQEKLRAMVRLSSEAAPARTAAATPTPMETFTTSAQPVRAAVGTSRRPRTRKPSAQAIGDMNTLKELDQHTSGSSASPERPNKRMKTEAGLAAGAHREALATTNAKGPGGVHGGGALGPSSNAKLKVEPEATATGTFPQGTHTGPVFHPAQAGLHIHTAGPTYPRQSCLGARCSLETSRAPAATSRAATDPATTGECRDEVAGTSNALVPASKIGRQPAAGRQDEEATAAQLRTPEAAGRPAAGEQDNTPGTTNGAAALLELARDAGGKAGSHPPGWRDGKTGSEQSASSSSLTRREPPSPRGIDQAPPGPHPPAMEHLSTHPSNDDQGPAIANHMTNTPSVPGAPAPSSNSASISTTANMEGAGQVTAEAEAEAEAAVAQQQQQQQDATSADCLLTDPKMVCVLHSLAHTRTPLREDTGPAGVLGLIMFCLNKAVAASTSKGQQGTKARLLHRSKQMLSQMVAAGWLVKEDGHYLLEKHTLAVHAALESASEDEQRRGKEAFAMWCRKTFVDEVADSRIINLSRSNLLINNTPHYLAWLSVITSLGPPAGLNEGAINLLHDTVMCYHCPEIAGSQEFMTTCKALVDLLQSSEKKGDKGMLMRKIYTCMASGYLNRGMANEAQEMAGKAISAQPKSPDLESALWIQGAARYNLGQFSDAEESFQKALKHYQNKVAGGMHHMRTLDFLADVRARQGKWREARTTYEQEVKVGQSRAGGGMHVEQEKAHASQARLLMSMGLFAEADEQFKAALVVLEQAGTQSFASAEYCELRAVALAEQYKVEEASKCLDQAEEIRRQLQAVDAPGASAGGARLSGGPKDLAGQEPVSVAPTTLVNVAKVAMMNAKYDEAEDYCDEVVSLDLDGADDEAAALQLQGQLFVMQHRFKEAKAKLQQVQGLLAESSDMDKLASLHYWLAQALSHLPGEETAAEEVLTQGMGMLQQKWPASSGPGGAAEYLNPRLECLLGQLQAARGSVNDDAAIKTGGLQRCKAGVEAAVKAWGKLHPYFASCLRHVAWAQMACFSYEAALVTLAEERKVWQSLEGGRQGLEYAGLAHARAHCHYALQRYGDAERLYRAAADVFQKVYSNSSLHKWSMVGALAALQDNPSASRTPQEMAVKEVCDVVGCNERKLLQWLDRHRQYWNPAGRR